MSTENAGQSAGTQQRPGRRRGLRWWVTGAVACLVIAVVAAQVLARAGEPEASPSTRATSSMPTPSQTATVKPAAAIQMPTDCDALYSPAMLPAFGELVLNPDWSRGAGERQLSGTNDQELQGAIDAHEPLHCDWASANGGSGVGLSTDVVSVSAELGASVEARLLALEASCYEELSGLRCVTSGSGDGGIWGESHFLRDGLWLATKYVNFAPEDYTENVVANLWDGR